MQIRKDALIAWVRASRVQITRYLLTGFSAVAVDWGTYLVLSRVLETSLVLAQVVAVITASFYVFVMNKLWSFGAKHDTKQQTRRFLILFAWNWFFQQAAFYIAVTHFGFYDMAVKFFVLCAMVSWNFLFYKYWVYAAHE